MPPLFATASAQAAEVRIGVMMGFTGPIESLAPDIAAAAELAIREVDDSKALLGGAAAAAVRGDTTCIDSAAASAAAERLITADRVDAIVGGDCSGVTTAMLQNVAMPNGVVMISPSATSPALSTLEDNGPVLPHRALGRPPGRGDRRGAAGARRRGRRHHLIPTMDYGKGPRRQHRHQFSRRRAAK